MKKLQLVFLLFLAWNTLFVAAQDKKLTETDAARMNPALFPERIQHLKWFGKTDYYQHFEKDSLWLTEAKTEKR